MAGRRIEEIDAMLRQSRDAELVGTKVEKSELEVGTFKIARGTSFYKR